MSHEVLIFRNFSIHIIRKFDGDPSFARMILYYEERCYCRYEQIQFPEINYNYVLQKYVPIYCISPFVGHAMRIFMKDCICLLTSIIFPPVPLTCPPVSSMLAENCCAIQQADGGAAAARESTTDTAKVKTEHRNILTAWGKISEFPWFLSEKIIRRNGIFILQDAS